MHSRKHFECSPLIVQDLVMVFEEDRREFGVSFGELRKKV